MDPYYTSKHLDSLKPEMSDKARALLDNCHQRGVTMQIDYTLRGPGVQAQLWCQSRVQKDIAAVADSLQSSGAPWLASLLKYDPDPSKRGKWVTNALPGASWHQYGLAMDAYAIDAQGRIVWNGDDSRYRIYADEAVKLGLVAGANWSRGRDCPHVQFPKESSPLSAGMSWAQIEEQMSLMFREEQ